MKEIQTKNIIVRPFSFKYVAQKVNTNTHTHKHDTCEHFVYDGVQFLLSLPPLFIHLVVRDSFVCWRLFIRLMCTCIVLPYLQGRCSEKQNLRPFSNYCVCWSKFFRLVQCQIFCMLFFFWPQSFYIFNFFRLKIF